MTNASTPSTGKGSSGGSADTPQDDIVCPFCGSADTHVEQQRGPALCRTVHYCNTCQQPFEEFS
ncbi:hypothetical protein [Natribaculum luteum]|uniref:PaaD-like zinc ribbon domain-containing protein n=1 Tax=Natribaculum luteum TaxID=1586232 RepID=UPI003CE5172B